MILDYNPSRQVFFLRVPRHEKEKLTALVRDHGFDFSETASTAEKAVLFTRDPYAAVTFFERATPRAKECLNRLAADIRASWASTDRPAYVAADGTRLWPFQNAGVAYALQRRHTLFGDQPGLGKTIQAIVLANEVRAKRVLVVCPASIRLQWAAMIRRWSLMEKPYVVYPILASKRGVHPSAAWTIISYDLLRSRPIHAALCAGRFDLLILDEAHYLKSTEARRTRAVFDGAGVKGVAEIAERIVALTGTPLPNRPRECLDSSVRVLTKRGWRRIIHVSKDDFLWDGEEWVRHDGLLYQGCEPTVSVAGISVTATHRFLGKSTWVSADVATQSTAIVRQILEKGSVNLPLSAWIGGLAGPLKKFIAGVIAAAGQKPLFNDFGLVVPGGVGLVVPKPERSFSNTPLFARMTRSENGCGKWRKVLLIGAIVRRIKPMPPMAAGGLKYGQNGFRIGGFFWFIFFHFLMWKTRLYNWIELITTGDMNRETFVGLHEKKIWGIGAKFGNSKNELTNLKPVYDLANAGPRQRFTVLSSRGPVIAHNCYTLARGLCWEAIDWQSEAKFQERYNPSGLEFGRGGGQYVREETGRLPELQNRLRANFMVRHLKKDVLTQLPEIRYEIVHAEETGEVRRALAAEALLDIDPSDWKGWNAEVLEHIATARRLMGVALAPQAAKYAEMRLEEGVEKLVIFAHHVEVLNILETALSRYGCVRVDGSKSTTARGRSVSQFRNNLDVHVFLGNIMAAGTGLDGLQDVASHALFAETSWTPGENQQGVDRLHRMGQQSGVIAEFFVSPGSLAEKILGTSLSKLHGIDAALDKNHGLM